jgi:cyclophilin family peptidyl-prolyl cis-trans isomerase
MQLAARRAPLPAGLILALVLGACVFGGATPTPRAACPTAPPSADEAARILSAASEAAVQTSKGSFTIVLSGDKAPIATANFVALARCGFYDGVTFHRVIPGFVIQAGDPQTKQNRGAFDALGTGGPGYGFAIETPAPGVTYEKYAVAMANSGRPDSNGSQFFIDLADISNQLPPSYTIFGKVSDGTAVVDAIGQVPTNGTPDTGAQNVPLDPVVIQSIALRGGAQSSPS